MQLTHPQEFSRSRGWWELAIVLALSLGASAVYSVVNIVERLTRETSLASQTATINRPLAERPLFDLTYQILGFVFALAPVLLVAFLLWQNKKPHLGALGFDGKHPFKQVGSGFLLAALIGIPGLAFYVFAKTIGINTTVIPAALDTYWWTVPVLVLQALRAALVEEIIVVAYLYNRLKLLGFSIPTLIIFSSVLRGTYHLYQGFGGFIGNIVMGLVFAWVYHRYGKILPLIIAHCILDIVSFVGFPLAVALLPSVFAA